MSRWLLLAALAVVVSPLAIASEFAPTQIGQGLPEVRYVRTLPAPNTVLAFGMMQTGTNDATWSADGQLIAAYAQAGTAIEIWTASGTFIHELQRYGPVGTETILAFAAGHSQIVALPGVPNLADAQREAGRLNDQTLTVFDTDSGAVIRDVAGPAPGQVWGAHNGPWSLAISPDQSLLAVAYSTPGNEPAALISTRDWSTAARLPGTGGDISHDVTSLAFSRDGGRLAAGRADGRVVIFAVGTNTPIEEIDCFTDAGIHGAIGWVSFNRDGTLLAAGTETGGSGRVLDNGRLAPPGQGQLRTYVPPNPARIFRLDNGRLLGSDGSFLGGPTGLSWSPAGDYVAFLALGGELHFWNPTIPNARHTIIPLGNTAASLAFSPDGHTLAVTNVSGILLFSVSS